MRRGIFRAPTRSACHGVDLRARSLLCATCWSRERKLWRNQKTGIANHRMCDRCAQNGTVFASFATNTFYAQRASRLARSLVAHAHVPCLCVAMVNLSISVPTIEVEAVEFDASKFPIGSKYCNHMAGWRLHSFLQPILLVHLLTQGFNVFSIDTDWYMVRPLATLPRYDVIALRDSHYLNVGLMYIRNTRATRRAFHRVANRSHVAWDQSVTNEEVAASSASCCQWNTGLTVAFLKDESVHKLKRGFVKTCNTRATTSMLPPNNLSYPQWRTDYFNFDNLHRQHTRCTQRCIDGGTSV